MVAIPLAKGEVVADRFVVEVMVGFGGMGAVYRARDLQTDQRAALKIIGDHHRSSGSRFSREARVLASLSHPAIVRYLTHGVSTSGTAFLAMEWLEGEDLSVRLARGGLDVEGSFRLVRRVCAGLAAAHARAVTHRDVKPSNIFMVDQLADRAKVIDFGVAHHATATRPLTRAGAVVGTIGYMAPEQAMGLPDVDARADVFAIGCVLFECLTGYAAFSAQHEVAVLAKVLRDDPPQVSELRPGLGAALDVLVSRLLAKDREQRPADAAAVLQALDRLGDLHGGAPIAVSSTRKSLIESEQRIVTVILAEPTLASARTLPLEQSELDGAKLDELSWLFEAEQLPMQGGNILLILKAGTGATAADRAAQAARCALRLGELRRELVLAVATGSMDQSNRVPVGLAVDRAAALLPSAKRAGRRIALDPLTAGLLGTRFDVQRVGDDLWLVGEVDQLEQPRLLLGRRTPFVGRDKELALLDATLAECVSDEVARVVLVTASPGVGKSRLGHEYLERVRAKGAARVLIARGEPDSMGSTLRVVRRLVRSAASLQEGDPMPLQQARLQDYLTALVPAAAFERTLEFLGELVGVPVEAPSPLLRAARNDPEVLREQTRRAFEGWIDAESARRPLVLFFDDLHWADPPSVSYVEELLHVYQNRRILVLGLARPEVHARFPRLWQRSGLQEIGLKGLTLRAGERLVRAVLGPDQLASERRIVDLADGNAFYLEELIRRAAEGRTDFPETVLAMVQSRIEALPAEERRILRAASVLGETFWAGCVDVLLGISNAAEWLDSLVELELLVPRVQARFPGEREYVFRHALLRDAAYAMLSEADKSVAHGMAGSWLEHAGETDARLLAGHYERGEMPDRAVSWITRAALAAVDAGDIEEARALSARGLTLGATGSLRGMLLLVDEYMSAWNRRSDAERLREAISLLPQAGAHWWLGIATSVFSASSTGDAQIAEPFLELALTSDPGTDLTGFRGLALQSLASGTILMGRPDIGWSLLDRFEPKRLDDPGCDPLFAARLQIARSHLGVYSPIDGKWQLQTALDWARESTAAINAAGSASGEMTALFILGCAWLFLGVYEQAEATLRTSRGHAQKKGNLLVEHYSQLVLAWSIVRRHRSDEAMTLLGPLAHSWDLNIVHGAKAVEAEAHFQAGRVEEALAKGLAATGGPAVPYRRMAWTTVARAQLMLGDPTRALESVAQAANDGNVAANLEFEVDLRVTEARALLQLGRVARARAVIDDARALLREVAAGISDPDLLRAFLHDVHAHAELETLPVASPISSQEVV